MDDPVCLQDIEDYAFKVLPKDALDYYRCGAGSEETLRNNRKDYLRYLIRPRILQDVSRRDLSITILGQKVSMPIGISPTAMQKVAHPDGECATARAAQELGTIFILSTVATSSIEEVAAAAPLAIKWFQLYIHKNREITLSFVKRAERAGYKALVLSVHAQMAGSKRVVIRNEFSLPKHLKLANFVNENEPYMDIIQNGFNSDSARNVLHDLSVQWKDVEWLQSVTSLPIILKGILTADDALKAVDLKVAGIIISNQGGRLIDTSPSSIVVLPEIARAVGNKIDIYLDGGIREGIDIFKAIALGAKMVFVGRPAIWGLAYAGQKGVQNMLSILQHELDQTLALTGCTSVHGILPDMVVHKNYYSKLWH